MAEKYKLIYFNLRGRAEAIRYILHYAGVEFEDHRIERSKWPTIKETMPTKQVPVLEITCANGSKRYLTQSMTIGRYLAQKLGLAGNDAWQSAQCDEVLDTLLDVGVIAALGYYEEDPDRKRKLYEKLKNDLFPSKLGFLEAKLQENGGKHLVGDKYTWADFTCACVMRMLQDYAGPASGDLNNNFPKLAELVRNVESLPAIAAYIAKRPSTDR